MEYIVIKDNIIADHRCGPLPQSKDGVEYRAIDSFLAQIGDDIRLYEDTVTWKPRPLSALVAEKLVSIPQGKKLSDDGLSFVDKTIVEKAENGELELPPTEKVENNAIVRKTFAELYAEGLISAVEYNRQMAKQRQIAYAAEADPLCFEYMRGDVDKAAWLAKITEIKERYPKV
jgi:ribosomal protein S19E (S16A)